MRVLSLAALLLAAVCNVMMADVGSFLPRVIKNGADLDFFGSYESDDNRIDGFGSKWTDAFLREKLTLYSDGFFYDPRFIQYHLSLSGALKQEDYSSTVFPSTGWKNQTGIEYNLRFYVLPEKPYNLEAFALRYEPLVVEHSPVEINSVETSQGILFRYRKKPYFFHSNYLHDSLDTSLYSSDVDTLSIGGEYFKQFDEARKLSAHMEFRPSKFSNSSDLTGNSMDLSAGCSIDYRDANIYSSLSWTNFKQESSRDFTFKNHNLNWLEQVRWYLPWNFRSTTYYRYQNGSNENSESLSKVEVKRNDLTEEVYQRIYDSLNNTYQFRYSTSSSSGGDSHAISNWLTTNYTKKIKGGNLQASFNIGQATTTSAGISSIIDETYPGVSVPGSFVLRQQYIDGNSIRIYVKSPLPPNEVIPLEENIHYTLIPSGDSYEVDVFALPGEFKVPGAYDFLASYDLTSGDFRMRTNALGYSLNFNLLHDTLFPYTNFSKVSSDILEGVFFGEPLDAKTTTFGVIYHRWSLRLLGEFQNLDWAVSPRDTWRGEVDYVSSVSRSLTYRATLQYQHRNFKQGIVDGVDPYTERITSASASISKELFARAMLFSFGGNYTKTNGLTDGTAYGLNSTLSWKVGKLDFTLGATAYHSDVTSELTFPTRRTHQYYYLNVKRKLF